MSYKFKAGECFAGGLRRIAADQSQKACGHLAAAKDVHKGVHEVRKSIKRLRALVRLFRGSVPASELRRIDNGLRDIGRSLAGTREVQGVLDGVAALEERFGKAAMAGPLAALKAELEVKKLADAQNGSVQAARKTLATDFAAVAAAIGELEPADDGFKTIRRGLEHTYRQARHWHARAYASCETDEALDETFHEWRKNVQRHWRHMQLLTGAWPDELKTRAALCHTIGETVGLDHDLSMLEAQLGSSGRHFGSVSKVRTVRQLCRKLQAELRESVRIDGERLFLERAPSFADRLERYWGVARREERAARPQPEAAADERADEKM